MNGKSPLHVLNGIGPKTEAAFKKAGIMTVEQLVWTFPRGYDTYSPVITVEEGRTLEDGERAAFCLGWMPRWQTAMWDGCPLLPARVLTSLEGCG